MGPRSRAGRRRMLGAAALIALLALPLGLGGHHHATSDTARDCSTCVVAHLSPLEVATPAILPTVVVSQPLLVAATWLGVAAVDRPAHPGRAPPAVLGDTAA